ncbi:DUF3806 domain-containing protein [Cellulomonas edaphi]|uniref:DUF3806 domain-containing protein n=1 Tax=Cellulomonas edaphi TaxID=3053468 RepID=A0ABT7S473_9CELL|nr:DUF3806 domain-containing protein [Cellulomons edaphi]MDM7830408.1 DUF3806 domain-containing protein [Cellulomons edaphi]
MDLLPSPHLPGDDEPSGCTAPLNAAEQVWAAQHRELVSELCDGDVDEWTVGHLFDRVHTTWLESEEQPDPAPLVHAFGVALGDLVLREVRGLAWVSYRDDDTRVTLALSSPDSPLVVFPIASVEEHWGIAADGWFTAHVHAVVHETVRQLRRSTADRSEQGVDD